MDLSSSNHVVQGSIVHLYRQQDWFFLNESQICEPFGLYSPVTRACVFLGFQVNLLSAMLFIFCCCLAILFVCFFHVDLKGLGFDWATLFFSFLYLYSRGFPKIFVGQAGNLGWPQWQEEATYRTCSEPAVSVEGTLFLFDEHLFRMGRVMEILCTKL